MVQDSIWQIPASKQGCKEWGWHDLGGLSITFWTIFSWDQDSGGCCCRWGKFLLLKHCPGWPYSGCRLHQGLSYLVFGRFFNLFTHEDSPYIEHSLLHQCSGNFTSCLKFSPFHVLNWEFYKNGTIPYSNALPWPSQFLSNLPITFLVNCCLESLSWAYIAKKILSRCLFLIFLHFMCWWFSQIYFLALCAFFLCTFSFQL